MTPVQHEDKTKAVITPATIFVWLAFFLLAGTYLRMQEPFYSYIYNNDEYILLGIIHAASLKQLLHFALYDSHPPLFYILAHYWEMIAPGMPFLRSMQLIFGMALVPLYYLIGRRIEGPAMGLCCAALVAFSFGAMVQSYIMRQYCVLLLTLSLNFYCYIRWREGHGRRAILCYAVTGWLVALSHFFSDFYFLSLVIFECVSLYRARAALGMRPLVTWLLANAAVFVLVAALYWVWQPTLSFYKAEFPPVPVSAEQLVVSTVASPFYAASYIFPAPYPLLAFLIFYVPFFLKDGMRDLLRPYLALGGIACLIAMGIYATNIFQWLGTRHSLWIFPLLVVPAGGVLADILKRRIASSGRFPVKGVLVLIAIAAVCDTGKRFGDDDYPPWQRGLVQSLSAVVDGLGPKDVFVTDKDGLNILANMQPYKTDPVFMNGKLPAFVPYKNTHMLVSPDYFLVLSPKAVRDMFERAEAAHELDGVDRIVIVKFWNKWPYYPLVTCERLPMQLLFSQRPGIPAPEDFTVVAMPKKRFFSEVMAPDGARKECLNPNQDTIPEWYYLPRTAKRSGAP